MNRKILLGLLASVTMMGYAAERTWTGGGTDSKWSTPANWGGTAPITGDTLVFAGSTKLSPVNDLPAGTVFGGIAFKSGAGAFTLSGNTVSVQGYITNGSSSAATVAFGIDLVGPLVVLPAAGNLAFTGPITGTGTYVQAGAAGAKTVTLSGTNTFTGDFVVTNGDVVAKNPNVFGNSNTNIVTFETNDARLLLDCGAGVWQIAKQLRLGPDKVNTGSLRLQTGEYEILKDVQLQGQVRISMNSGVPRLTFKESVRHYSGSGLFVPNPPTGSEIVFEKAIDVNRQVYADTDGILVFKATGNKWNSLNPLRADLRAMTSNVFPTTVGVTMGGNAAIINLLGNDQTVQRVETPAATLLPTTRRSIYSATPATLTMNASGSANLCASFDGVVSLLKGGLNNTRITMTGLVSTTYGNVTITNGTLAIDLGAGFPNVSNITVRGANSMLDVWRPAALPTKGNVFLVNGGKLQLTNGSAQIVNRLYINGTEQVAGVYSAAELPGSIQGAGTIEVLAVDELVVKDTVWDGGALPDTGFSTAQNWIGDETPNFVNGFANLIFATGGTNGVVSGLVRAYGLLFLPGTEFTVQGGGALELGVGGICFATDSSGSITNRVLSEIAFSQPLMLAVTNAQAAKAVLELGRLNDGGSGTAISLVGTNACYVFRGSNTFGNLTVPPGVIVSAYAPEPLGGGSGSVTVNPGGWIELYDTKIVTKGSITVQGDPQSGYNGALRFMTGTNVVSAPIGNGSSRVKAHGSAVAELDGGMSGSGSIDSNTLGGWVRFRKNPVQMSNIFYNGGFLIFACTNNAVSTLLDISAGFGSVLRFDVTNAFSTLTRVLHRNPCMIDLNGCDQRIGVLDGLTASGLIYSVQPAVLTIDHSVLSANGYPGVITGRVSVVKTGIGTNLITGISTTFGSFTVENGCLDVSGSFGPNSTNVSVKAGSLIVRNSGVISDAATVSLTGGKIELADGVRDVVYLLYLNGSLQNPGTYGSTQSPAQYKMDTYFRGTGVLRVLSGKPGTRIILR